MKIIDLVLGAGIALMLTSLIPFGIETFYPLPEYPETDYSEELQSKEFNCDFNDFKCLDEQDAYYEEQDRQLALEEEEYEKQEKEYEKAEKDYYDNIFLIETISGFLLFLGGLLLLLISSATTRGVAIGILLTGMVMIGNATLYVSFPYDDSSSGKSEFVIGLLVAIILIGVSMWFARKYHERDAQSPS